MKFEPFELERIQSLNENRVDVNLGESGIDPMSLKELMSEAELEELLSLKYPYTIQNVLPLLFNMSIISFNLVIFLS